MFQIAKLHIISLNVNACLLYFCSSDINAYFYGILDYRENYTYKKMGHFVCKTILAATILIFGCMPAYAFQHDDDVETAIKGIVEKYSNTEGVECMTIVKGKGLELLKMMLKKEFGKTFISGVTGITIIDYSNASQQTCVSLRNEMNVFLSTLKEFDLSKKEEFTKNNYIRCFANSKAPGVLSDFIIALENEKSRTIMHMSGEIVAEQFK